RLDVDHVDEQQCVVRGECAARLADDVGHRHLVLAARLAESVDDVVRVLLDGVVDGCAARGAGAVVVDAQATADVDVLDAHAELAQLDVVPRDLGHRRLDVADVRDLRAEMEVHHLQDVELAGGLEAVEHARELRRVQTELAPLAGGLRPAAGAGRRQLDAYARRRLDVGPLRDLEQCLDLARLLDDDQDLVPELLADQREAEVLLVLVAVADDEVVGPLGHREHRLQLRLAADLEADAVTLAERDDLLEHVTLLVHLDRVDRRVASRVLEFVDRGLELLRERLDARSQDIGEAKEQRKAYALRLQIHGQLEQVEAARRILGRVHGDVPPVIDVEIADAPAVYVVELARVLDRPAHLSSEVVAATGCGSAIVWRILPTVSSAGARRLPGSAAREGGAARRGLLRSRPLPGARARVSCRLRGRAHGRGAWTEPRECWRTRCVYLRDCRSWPGSCPTRSWGWRK